MIPGVNPVEDIDGDKTAEIVLSLYNYDYKTATIGDGKWHVVALEPMTGMLKLDLSDMYLSGMYVWMETGQWNSSLPQLQQSK